MQCQGGTCVGWVGVAYLCGGWQWHFWFGVVLPWLGWLWTLLGSRLGGGGWGSCTFTSEKYLQRKVKKETERNTKGSNLDHTPGKGAALNWLDLSMHVYGVGVSAEKGNVNGFCLSRLCRVWRFTPLSFWDMDQSSGIWWFYVVVLFTLSLSPSLCADALQAGASQFEASAGKLKRKYWWKNCKVWKLQPFPVVE